LLHSLPEPVVFSEQPEQPWPSVSLQSECIWHKHNPSIDSISYDPGNTMKKKIKFEVNIHDWIVMIEN
jgi:hypothetical protein